MPNKLVKKGDQLRVNFELEYSGTIHNSLILVEGQTIGSTASSGKINASQEIIADADPVNWIMFFFGEVDSTIKSHKLTINGRTFKGPDDIKVKTKQTRIELQIPYAFFRLIESPEPLIENQDEIV